MGQPLAPAPPTLVRNTETANSACQLGLQALTSASSFLLNLHPRRPDLADYRSCCPGPGKPRGPQQQQSGVLGPQQDRPAPPDLSHRFKLPARTKRKQGRLTQGFQESRGGLAAESAPASPVPPQRLSCGVHSPGPEASSRVLGFSPPSSRTQTSSPDTATPGWPGLCSCGGPLNSPSPKLRLVLHAIPAQADGRRLVQSRVPAAGWEDSVPPGLHPPVLPLPLTGTSSRVVG